MAPISPRGRQDGLGFGGERALGHRQAPGLRADIRLGRGQDGPPSWRRCRQCPAVEHLANTSFAKLSGDACDSFHRWPMDLDIVEGLNLNSYRSSIAGARIEPAPGEFSLAMLRR
jgi:hypothetical protein